MAGAVNCIILKLFCFTDMNPLQHKSYSIFPIDHISLETFYKTNFYRRSIEQISIEELQDWGSIEKEHISITLFSIESQS